MTFVNRHTIKISSNTGATDYNITIPVSLDFQPVDQYDIIKEKFVDVEVEKSINPIIDYEKVRLLPVDEAGINVNKVTYTCGFLSSGNVGSTNYWSDAGMTNDDIKFRKNRCTRGINKKFNKCLTCHSWANYKEAGATKISQTHFSDRENNVLANIAPRRYFCTQCHVPQVNAKPLVENTFNPLQTIKRH